MPLLVWLVCCAGLIDVDTIAPTNVMGLFNAEQQATQKDHANGKHQTQYGLQPLQYNANTPCLARWHTVQIYIQKGLQLTGR